MTVDQPKGKRQRQEVPAESVAEQASVQVSRRQYDCLICEIQQPEQAQEVRSHQCGRLQAMQLVSSIAVQTLHVHRHRMDS